MVSALAALALALPVGLAHADVAAPLSGTVGPAAANGVMTVWQRVEATWARVGPADIDADGHYTAAVPVGGTYAVTYDDAALGEHDVNADGALGRPRDTQEGVTVSGDAGATLDFPFPQLTASLTVTSVTDADGVVIASPGLGLYALIDEGDGPGWASVGVAPTLNATTGALQFTGLPSGTYAVTLQRAGADDHLYLSDGSQVKAWDTDPPSNGSFGLSLASSAHRSIRIALGYTPPPVVYVPPADPTPTPSTSPTPGPSQTAAPAPGKPAPTAAPTPDPVRIDPAPPAAVLQLNVPATPQIAIVPATKPGSSAGSKDQGAVDNALVDALAATQQQALAAGVTPPTGPTVQANLVPIPTAMPPGLYIQVIDGLINITNNGAVSFQAGQFGYLPSSRTPPILLPSNPGLKFTLPPVFTTSVSTTVGKTQNIDCEVRRVDVPGATSVDVKKTYCNRVAVPRTGTHGQRHRAWQRHVTVKVRHARAHVRTPALRVPGPGWYRIVTTHHLVLRFTAISDHGKRPKHPVHVTRTAAIRSITYVHVTRP